MIWPAGKRGAAPRIEAALAFTSRVGAIAEADNHHPEIPTEWGEGDGLVVDLYRQGLHVNDFILAVKTAGEEEG